MTDSMVSVLIDYSYEQLIYLGVMRPDCISSNNPNFDVSYCGKELYRK